MKTTHIEHGIRRLTNGKYEVRVGTRRHLQSRTVATLTEARAKRRELEAEQAATFGRGAQRLA